MLVEVVDVVVEVVEGNVVVPVVVVIDVENGELTSSKTVFSSSAAKFPLRAIDVPVVSSDNEVATLSSVDKLSTLLSSVDELSTLSLSGNEVETFSSSVDNLSTLFSSVVKLSTFFSSVAKLSTLTFLLRMMFRSSLFPLVEGQTSPELVRYAKDSKNRRKEEHAK